MAVGCLASFYSGQRRWSNEQEIASSTELWNGLWLGSASYFNRLHMSPFLWGDWEENEATKIRKPVMRKDCFSPLLTPWNDRLKFTLHFLFNYLVFETLSLFSEKILICEFLNPFHPAHTKSVSLSRQIYAVIFIGCFIGLPLWTQRSLLHPLCQFGLIAPWSSVKAIGRGEWWVASPSCSLQGNELCFTFKPHNSTASLS